MWEMFVPYKHVPVIAAVKDRGVTGRPLAATRASKQIVMILMA